MKLLTKRVNVLFWAAAASVLVLASCGGGAKDEEGVKLSEKGQMLTSTVWKPDVNANINEGNEALDSTTNIKSNVQLQGDVKAIADFAAGTLQFGQDTKDPSKLSYKRTYGKGFLSTSVLGYWNFNEDESMIVMREWDSQAGKEKPAKNYTIVEISADKLVLKEEGAVTADVYVPNK